MKEFVYTIKEPVRIEGADEDTAAPAMEKFFSEHL